MGTFHSSPLTFHQATCRCCSCPTTFCFAFSQVTNAANLQLSQTPVTTLAMDVTSTPSLAKNQVRPDLKQKSSEVHLDKEHHKFACNQCRDTSAGVLPADIATSLCNHGILCVPFTVDPFGGLAGPFCSSVPLRHQVSISFSM